jgi:calcineurin-like phosphoesterase family protein
MRSETEKRLDFSVRYAILCAIMELKMLIFCDSLCAFGAMKNRFCGSPSYEVHLVNSRDEFFSLLEMNNIPGSGVRYVVVAENESNFGGCMPNNIIHVEQGSDMEKVARQVEWVCSDFGRERLDTSHTWFISDTHFSHANVIRYCRRPWISGIDRNGERIVTEDDVRDMDNDIIKNWNSVVRKDDIVWHLGDFAFGDQSAVPEFVARLNGKINLVLGNHDRKKIGFYYDSGFHRVYDHPVVIDGFAILSHIPLSYVRAPFYNIYGHVHDCGMYGTWTKDGCCVCVERHNYTPVSMVQIKLKYKELNNERDA